MRLSELKTGENGIIVKVYGHGGFRKRIIEMGFIRGKVVEVLLNAPLHDPVKYKIMGYEVSLRHSEAEQIEIISMQEAEQLKKGYIHTETSSPFPIQENDDTIVLTDKQLHDAAMKKRRTINVALVGNPNCGKTSLFNFASGAHERVGNYSGVTVDAKEGFTEYEGYKFNLIDLPGTYSLSAYSPEELYVRKQIIENTPDVIINVIDTSNLERNLYLTTQLIDMHQRMVCALNMFDETEKRGDNVDYVKLGQLFGVPMIPTVFTSGKGVKTLFHTIISVYENEDYVNDNEQLNPKEVEKNRQLHKENKRNSDKITRSEDNTNGKQPQNEVFRHIHINHGHEIEQGIADIQKYLKTDENIRLHYSTRYLAIKILERDKDTEILLNTLPYKNNIVNVRNQTAERVREETGDDLETAIMDAKYGFIHGALQEAHYHTGNKKDTYKITHLIDGIITNKYLGFPIFLVFLFIMFTTTFVVGQFPMDWIDAGVAWLGNFISTNMPAGPVKDMLVDGIIGGVGAVIVFLPQILILYFFISYMEDSGYMARAAFIMDKLMHKMGLHGKSFIPLIMGFGCNVPAVMATRTIESRRSRLVTMLILPLMSCSARLPIYIMITGTFFTMKYRSLIMMSLYLIGVLMAILMSRLFTKTVVKGEDTPFVMELPPYRFPTWKAISRHTWEKGKQYLKKMGGIILVASIIVWALGYFPHNDSLDRQEQQKQSYIGHIGRAIEPIFRAQGFDWKLDVGLVAGVGAKEIVASTMGVLYSNDETLAEDNGDNTNNRKYQILNKEMSANGITPLTAYCFLLFVLLYFPCIATIAAIKGETGSWKWALFTACYTTLLAWCVSAAVYQVGMLFV